MPYIDPKEEFAIDIKDARFLLEAVKEIGKHIDYIEEFMYVDFDPKELERDVRDFIKAHVGN